MTFEPWMSPRQAAEQIANAMYADGKIRDYLVEAVTTACQHFSNEQLERSGDRAMGAYLERQQEWSSKTFGPGKRTIGVTEHIKKEIEEIRKDPDDLMEWIDVIILAVDGFWRAGGHPSQVMEMLIAKQAKNFARKWPAIAPEDQAVEHDRSEDQG